MKILRIQRHFVWITYTKFYPKFYNKCEVKLMNLSHCYVMFGLQYIDFHESHKCQRHCVEILCTEFQPGMSRNVKSMWRNLFTPRNKVDVWPLLHVIFVLSVDGRYEWVLLVSLSKQLSSSSNKFRLFDIQRTLHLAIFFIVKPMRYTNFSNLFYE